MPIISRIVKGVGSGIGLASEAIADHKERKASKETRGTSPNPQASSASSQAPISTSPYPQEKEVKNNEDDDDSSDSDLDNDRAEWALDDAAAALDPPEYSEELSDIPPMPVDELVKSFVRSHNSDPTFKVRPLPMPVVLPQRRPKDKTRGFIHAYAPILGEYSGIDQQTFIDFIVDFHKASKTSPVFDVINIACFGIGMVPNPIAMGVSIAVQVANTTAKEIQGRYRTNNYLDQINETLFMPKGLYAMIMTFKPDTNDAVLGIDLNSTDTALTKSLSPPDSELRQKLKSIRLSSGTTKGEQALPEFAPLVYPALDAAAAAAVDGDGDVQLSEKKQNALKSSGKFLASYLDRRAQATYASMNPDSKLAAAAPPPEKKFASRFSDPNHPANSGTIVALLTGGKFDPKGKKRGRRAQRRAAKRGEVLSEHDIRNAEMGRKTKPKGPIGRMLQKNVLYLIITNLPSESELKEMNQELDRMKSAQGRSKSPLR